jgi:hypothetical protein
MLRLLTFVFSLSFCATTLLNIQRRHLGHLFFFSSFSSCVAGCACSIASLSVSAG